MNEKKRLNYIDGIRFFAVFLVVLSHFNIGLQRYGITILGNSYILPSVFANEDTGTLGVSLFFIISGLSLYYNYEDNFDFKTYYKKRFLSIYPQFWCSYALVFLFMFFKYKQFWFEANGEIPTSRFLLTIFGMDGYFSYLGKNFYMIGEWFLGCLVLLYIAFPVLLYSVKKFPVLTLVIATILYSVVVVFNPFEIGITRNLMIRGYDFLIGMLLVRYLPADMSWLKEVLLLIISGFVFLFSISYKVEQFGMFFITITGISLFVLLRIVLQKINISQFVLVKTVNKFSYDVFLLHHVMISICFGHFRGQKYSFFEGCALVLIYVIMLSLVIKISRMVKDSILKCYERRVLRKSEE